MYLKELNSKDSATGIITAVKEEVIQTGVASDEDIIKIINHKNKSSIIRWNEQNDLMENEYILQQRIQMSWVYMI